MAKIWIDGRDFDADPAKNLLYVCLSHGFDLPYFCWHPALGSVGACRQCAVKQFRDAEDSDGRLVMACMTPATDGTRISIADQEARELRAGVVEWLMANHPHDCPVCDEGGECHLQDMTVMTGHNTRRFRFPKRTYRNQDLGPLVNHEMNRCIQCYRCVRFYGDYAGGHDLQALGAHDHVYFGRHRDGVLESEFSGNLVEVCPTGVFTDKSLKSHYTRKWDLLTAPSICVHCALGCNVTPGERYGELRRVRARYHGQVNGYFLCDRGRYGYGFVNHERRIRRPLRPAGPDQPAAVIDAGAALEHLAGLCSRRDRLLGIGSPRASLEANFALRSLVGGERFHHGVSARDRRLVATAVEALRRGPARIPSLREVERCDAVLVLGEDVTHTAPMLALALRQAAQRQPRKIASEVGIPDWNQAAIANATQGRAGPVYVASPAATRLDDAARGVARAAPEDVARLGFAIARELDSAAPAVDGLGDETRALAAEIAAALAAAERPLVVSGTGCGSAAVIRAAADVAGALSRKRESPTDLFLTLPECNSMGLALLGGGSLEAAFAAVGDGRADTVIVLENDLTRRADPETVERFLSAAEHVVVIDHSAHATGAAAELLLPAATFAEGDGTLVNNEGRAQRFFQVMPPAGDVRESWRWLRDAIRLDGNGAVDWQNLDDVVGALAAAEPAFRDLPRAAPGAEFRRAGARLPRALHRYSGRTAVDAAVDVHEPKPPDDPDSPLSFTMEGFDGPPPADLASEFWSPGWNSIQALNRFQEEVAGPLRGGDPGVRLLSTATTAAGPDYSTEVPAAFEKRAAEWRVVPLHHIFGSEELSVLSPGIAELTPAAYVALASEDAAELGVEAGAKVSVSWDGGRLELPLRVEEGLPPGVAGLPAGLPDLVLAEIPRWVKLAEATP